MKKTSTLLITLLILSSFMALSEHTVSSQQPTEDTWERLKPIPAAGGYRAVTVAGQIHVIGGSNHYVYDPNNDEWITKKPLPTPRGSFAIASYKNKIYAIGGTYGSNGEYFTSDAVEVYDPQTDTWETKTPMPTARSSLCANEVDGKIYLMGGQTGGSYSIVGLNEVYDVAADRWTTKEPLYNPVDDYASAVVDGRIYILGGFEGLHHGAPVDFNQIYDPKTDTWSRGAQMPNVTRWASAVATTGQKAPKQIYVIGGVTDVFAYNTTQIYNPKTDTWTLGAEMSTAKCQLTTAVNNDIIYAIGGRPTVWDQNLPTNERYIPNGYTTSEDQREPNTDTFELAAVTITITGVIIGAGLLIHHKKQKYKSKKEKNKDV
jgi:N-acetylneuraminic acid mutarotase